ncbi:MAG: nitrogenase reductase [Deltaproteobacteria bacterium]|nr:nitrogenase reductase [Deltaproteobacteria bacterium]
MPKVIVCGRGGSGKSSFVSLLAGELANRETVLVVDADESNLGLNVMLGLEPPTRTLMDFLGGKPAVRQKLLALLRGEGSEDLQLFEGSLELGSLPEDFKSGGGQLTLVRVGKIEHSMEGCACPMGVVARSFLKQITADNGLWVLVDTEAGVEHFGRGILEGADYILVTVDPSQEAVAIAEKACGLAKEAGKACGIVMNKVDGETEPLLKEKLMQRSLSPLGSIPLSAIVSRANLLGDPLADESMREELRQILVSVATSLRNDSSRRRQ